MRFWATVSFESDTRPVETVRFTELEAPDFEEAIRRAVIRASKARPKNSGRYRSLVVVAEELIAASTKTTNKTGPEKSALEIAGDSGEGPKPQEGDA